MRVLSHKHFERPEKKFYQSAVDRYGQRVVMGRCSRVFRITTGRKKITSNECEKRDFGQLQDVLDIA